LTVEGASYAPIHSRIHSFYTSKFTPFILSLFNDLAMIGSSGSFGFKLLLGSSVGQLNSYGIKSSHDPWK
jgi:hypothetical protein